MRIVYRLKGADDLTLLDLDALDRLAAAGCQVRYSKRLHAKVVIVDDTDVVVSSSNLTSTAGYAPRPGPWQNEELISGQAAKRLEIGHLPANPTVRVTLDRDRFLTLHAAVLGMTGAGKSNAVKVLTFRLLAQHPDLRVVVVDTHGVLGAGQGNEHRLRVRFEPGLLDEVWVKRACRSQGRWPWASRTSRLGEPISVSHA